MILKSWALQGKLHAWKACRFRLDCQKGESKLYSKQLKWWDFTSSGFVFTTHIIPSLSHSSLLFFLVLLCSVPFYSFLFLFLSFLLLLFTSSLFHLFSRPSSFHQFFTPLCSFTLCFLLFECSEHLWYPYIASRLHIVCNCNSTIIFSLFLFLLLLLFQIAFLCQLYKKINLHIFWNNFTLFSDSKWILLFEIIAHLFVMILILDADRRMQRLSSRWSGHAR